MHIMYCEGCRLRPISNRPMSGFVAGRGGRQICLLFSGLGRFKKGHRLAYGCSFEEIGKERHRKLRRTFIKHKQIVASLVKGK